MCGPDPDADWQAKYIAEMHAVLGLWKGHAWGRRGHWAGRHQEGGLDEDDEDDEEEEAEEG